MNAIDKLLSYDAGKVETPKKTVKMKLKKFDGEEFDFPIQAIDPETMADLQEGIFKVNIKSNDAKMNGTFHRNAMTIVEGCPQVFMNRQIMDKFKAKTPKELVKAILVSGEIEDLRNEIETLSGYEVEEEEDKVKN